ncbi:MAG: radical SAM protein [Cyanobacteria bacterium J06632_19]
MTVERISIELTNQCSKKCSFCYNHSHPEGKTTWQPDELINFIQDCAMAGTSSVSFGGGEPLEYPQLFTILKKLQGKIFRSVTTNGLLLKGKFLEELISASPDKVHISIHFPENTSEVDRVIQQVQQLSLLGIKSGVNLLVCRSNLSAAFQAAQKLHNAGIENDRLLVRKQIKCWVTT